MKPTMMEEIVGHNVTRLKTREGPTIQIGNLQLTWKARGEDTGYQFSIYEMSLAPGVGIPLHKHPYPEFFYVLEGEMDFARLNDAGDMEWMACIAGESIAAPCNAPHTFHNHSTRTSRFLSVSNHHHEVMLNSGGVSVDIDNPIAAPIDPQVFERFVKASAENQAYVVEV